MNVKNKKEEEEERRRGKRERDKIIIQRTKEKDMESIKRMCSSSCTTNKHLNHS